MRSALHAAAKPSATTNQKASNGSGGIMIPPARSWRTPDKQNRAAAPAPQPAATHNEPRATRRGRTGARSPARSSISSSIDRLLISFDFNQSCEFFKPAMDIHLHQRFALPANLRRFGNRGTLDLDQRDRLRLSCRQQAQHPVEAEPGVDGLVLRPDRGVIVAQFGLVALAAQHIDPAIARDRRQPWEEGACAIPGRQLAMHRHQRFLDQVVDLRGRDAPREIAFKPLAAIGEQRAIGGAVAALRRRHQMRQRGLVDAHLCRSLAASASSENKPPPRTINIAAIPAHSEWTGHQASGKTNSWMTSVMTSSAAAAPRVARPSSSSAGKRCSAKTVTGTAIAGASGRPENSDANRSYCDGSICRKPPSISLVCPERQNTPASATRSRNSASPSGRSEE